MILVIDVIKSINEQGSFFYILLINMDVSFFQLCVFSSIYISEKEVKMIQFLCIYAI